MGRFWHTVRQQHILVGALKVSLFVGSVLNLVNQGEGWWHHGTVSWGHVLMNYLIPFCVSSYSAARNETKRP